jgi:DNA-binding response OmpR family regulator
MRLLIVEDEREIGEFLKSNLEKEGFCIDYATNGEEGSFMARTNTYEVIILDYILPMKNGLDILRELRSLKKSVPIIMLSARGEIQHKIELFKEGADDYVTKPFSFQELCARIRVLLRRPYSIKSNVHTIDDLTIDSDSQQVTCAGLPIYLTRKEFLLLECLAKEKGKVMSRGTLMENVWDMNIDPFSNTLETHILNLRKKIGKKGKELIKTVPGRGYRID